MTNKTSKKKAALTQEHLPMNKKDYLLSMSSTPALGESTHWFQMIPAIFFTAVIIMITRMAQYQRPMEQFFWSDGNSQLVDFFSYYKMVAIIICAVIAIIILLYRLFIQSFYIKKSIIYIPMIIYVVFVLLSYIFSDYKIFAFWGWNDRFEGTLTIFGYMIMLFYIINSVNSEKNVKLIIYPIAVSSAILGLLGVTQALDHDFFQTTLGKKLITPSWFWDKLDSLNFTFQNKEIYQTVYNINYVSFYLTLLIPLFGMLFINKFMAGKEEVLWKKIVLACLFALLIFNLIGSASSGGLMGMAVVVLLGIIVLNKKIIKWIKPVTILLLISILIAGVSYQRWMPDLTYSIKGVLGTQDQQNSVSQNQVPNVSEAAVTADGATNSIGVQQKIDYIETKDNTIIFSYNGNEITFLTFPDDPGSLKISDADGKSLNAVPTEISPIYKISDERFSGITIRPAKDESGVNYFIIMTDGTGWPFAITQDGPKYLTGLRKTIDLHKVPAVGWENNQSFGSGRGYIWSRTIPMMKETLILGHGADTYCAYFPHDDYVGKYNSGTFTKNISIVVDKPHNMYFGAIIGTGAISVLALLILFAIYILQSFLIYKKERFTSFNSYIGVGIFLGICGFLVTGIVDDSSVSVMPMFYGLLGTGIAINMLLKEENLTQNSN